jgi:site-specific recombinase XerD
MLDEITTADIERHLATIEGDGIARATVNRYRDRLSAMYKRALRLGLVERNPVKGIEKHKEPGGRIVYLPLATKERATYEEEALRAALRSDESDLFTVSVHTGLRWSEQVGLRWRDVDMLAATITVPESKHGEARQMPMNATVRSVLMDLGARGRTPNDSSERVFRCRYTEATKFFPAAVQRAQAALRDAGMDASRLDSYTWHGNRHTFASRLVMAGVDLRAVQELGGWN